MYDATVSVFFILHQCSGQDLKSAKIKQPTTSNTYDIRPAFKASQDYMKAKNHALYKVYTYILVII